MTNMEQCHAEILVEMILLIDLNKRILWKYKKFGEYDVGK